MTIAKNTGRQEAIVAYVDFDYTMMASGVAAPAIDLPIGAVVIAGAVTITTAFNSGSGDTLVVGDQASANRYKSSYSVASTGRTALVPTGTQVDSTNNKMAMTWTGSGTAATAGAGRLFVEYYVNDRAAFSQG